MERRGFLRAILASACAPAIVRASSLMRVTPAPIEWIERNGIITPLSIGEELARITRSAFLPKLITQVYASSPLMAALLDDVPMLDGVVVTINPYCPPDLIYFK